ncbi:MAG: carboxypeptidase-like regulatory domain-containing protein, partial [Sphingobacteriales bacterium]
MKKYLCTLVLMHLLSAFCLGQYQIKGKVISSTDQLPLPGASVSVLNTQFSSKTDEKGQFNLQLIAGTYQFSVSYLGYKTHTKELKIDSDLPHVLWIP